MALTLPAAERRTTWWNSVITPLITGQCPDTGAEFDMGSGNTCPYCHRSTSGPEHWKWFNPDEGLPEPPG